MVRLTKAHTDLTLPVCTILWIKSVLCLAETSVVDGMAQVADALTKLHGDGVLLRAVCRQTFAVLVTAPEIMAARRQERT